MTAFPLRARWRRTVEQPPGAVGAGEPADGVAGQAWSGRAKAAITAPVDTPGNITETGPEPKFERHSPEEPEEEEEEEAGHAFLPDRDAWLCTPAGR